MEDSQLKRLQQEQNKMLELVADICEKHKIVYYLSCGSLLGAVRHKGFIPWDDDIDVVMPYEDYKKFLEVAQTELGESYFVQNSHTDKNWYRSYTTIRKNNTTMMHAHWSKYHIHQGIWLDIFPLASMRNMTGYKIKKLVLALNNIWLMENYVEANKDDFRKRVKPVGLGLFKIIFALPYDFRLKMHDNIDAWICSGNGKGVKGEVVAGFVKPFPYACYDGEPTFVEFEGRNYMTMPNVEAYLIANYGKDYMTPVRFDRGHEHIILDFDNSYEKYLE